MTKPRKPQVQSAFCPHCGASLVPLTAAQKRTLAAVYALEREEARTRAASITERAGLHRVSVDLALARLRVLGYLSMTKAYRRGYHVYRLSPQTRGDLDLMERIHAWANAAVLPPGRMAQAVSLDGEQRWKDPPTPGAGHAPATDEAAPTTPATPAPPA